MVKSLKRQNWYRTRMLTKSNELENLLLGHSLKRNQNLNYRVDVEDKLN